jgi:hypothetical protein
MRLLDQLRSVLKSWAPHVESPASVEALSNIMVASAIPALSFYVMLGLATAIATLGLLSNSAPVVIGAMIVAPLMQPIVSFSFGVVVADWRLILYSTLTVVSGVFLVIGLAFATTELIGLRIAGSEILGRTAPTLLDLGIACALALTAGSCSPLGPAMLCHQAGSHSQSRLVGEGWRRFVRLFASTFPSNRVGDARDQTPFYLVALL